MDEGLTCGSLFSGIGLLDYGLALAGFEHAWFCEADEWRRGILARRWPGVPIYEDVRDIGRRDPPAADAASPSGQGAWAGRAALGRATASRGVSAVDVIAGGFPCKGASTAGKRTGFDHPETVLWREMARAVGELRPRYVLVENVANLLVLRNGSLWGEVLGTLAALGYDTVWDCLPAAAVGAPHRRDRVFAVATDTASGGGQGARAEWPALGRALGDDPDASDAAHVGPERDGRARNGRAGPAHGGEPAADALRPGLEGPGLRRAATDGTSAPADAARLPEGRPSASAGTDGQRTRAGDHAAADPGNGRLAQQQAEHRAEPPRSDADALRRGVRVEWGPYEPAIRRWEQASGVPAPEPLVRRVDDRSAARVERSRLSALGDGVQVQIGRIAGEYIIELERERRMSAAA